MAFLAGLWLLTKYAPAPRLNHYLIDHETLWTRSSWVARQVAAALPRLSRVQQRMWSDRLVRAGLYDGVGVLAHSRQLARLTSLDHQLRSYLLHPSRAPYNYDLPKVLLALTMLSGSMATEARFALRDELLLIVDDPAFRELILAQLPSVRPPVVREPRRVGRLARSRRSSRRNGRARQNSIAR